MLLVAITIFSVLIILCCYRNGEPDITGKDGINNSLGTGFDYISATSLNQLIPACVRTQVVFNSKITDDSNSFDMAISNYKTTATAFYNINAKLAFLTNFLAEMGSDVFSFKNGILLSRHNQISRFATAINIFLNTAGTVNDLILIHTAHHGTGDARLISGQADCSFSEYTNT